MSKTLRDQDYLSHIQEAINKIHRYIAGKSEMDFIADDLSGCRDPQSRNHWRSSDQI